MQKLHGDDRRSKLAPETKCVEGRLRVDIGGDATEVTMTAAGTDPATGPPSVGEDDRRGGVETDAGVSEGTFVSFDGTVIAFEVHTPTTDSPDKGSEREPAPVVCLNGIACVAHAYWDPLLSCLRPKTTVVLWDYRGHGRSGDPANPSEITVPSFARDLLCLLDHLKIAGPVLVGHSFGVQVALEALRIDRTAARGLVAVAGPHRRPLGDLFGLPLARFAVSILEPMAEALSPHTKAVWRAGFSTSLPYWVGKLTRMAGPKATADSMAAYFDGLGALDPVLLLRMLKAMDYQDARDFLPQLDVPLLAVAGRRDVMTPLPVMKELASLAPHGRLEVVEDAGHTLPIETPERLCALVTEFLRQVTPEVPLRDGAVGRDG